MPENENMETIIYSIKGGDILWQSEGTHALRIGLFLGFNQNAKDYSKMYGRAFLVKII